MADSEIIFSIQESPEGGYEARALGHAIFTQADTMEELKRNVREAAHCHFDDPFAAYRLRCRTGNADSSLLHPGSLGMTMQDICDNQ